MNCKRKIIHIVHLLTIIINSEKINARKVQVCDLMIAIDEPLFLHYGTKSSKLIQMVQLHVKELNNLYQLHIKDFRDEVIYFKIKTIRFLFNFCHNCNTNMSKTLEEFTKIPSSDYCLAHLFTYRDFTENIVGFAYTGSPKFHGGICAKSHNTGLTSLLNHGVKSTIYNNMIMILNILLHNEEEKMQAKSFFNSNLIYLYLYTNRFHKISANQSEHFFTKLDTI